MDIHIDPRLSSETVIKLSADAKARLIEELGKTAVLCGLLRTQINRDELQEGFTVTALSLFEHQIQDLAKYTGVPSQSAEEIEARHARLRAANLRIHELEAQIGTAAAQSDLRCAVKALHAKLYGWWKARGLGHISEFSIGEHGLLRVKFSAMLFPPGGPLSETPETDKVTKATWLASLTARGVELLGESKGVLDSAASREALETLVAEIPTAEVLDYHSHRDHTSKRFLLRDIEVMIREPHQILSLSEEMVSC